MRKAIGMMEIRLARWMRQRPVRSTATGFIDQRRETQTPSGITWQARQPIQLQRGLQCVALGARLHFNSGRAYLGRNAHPTSVAAEPICRPLCRGRKVEFVICGVPRRTDECLEAGVPPKLIGTCGRPDGRHAQVAYFAGHDIAQHQTASAWTRDVYVYVCRCKAKRVRMKSQRLAHAGNVA
jgi:hypothetical protein